MNRPIVAIIGSAMMDLSAYIDRIPAAGETLKGDSFTTGFGGKGANQAVMAAIAGAESYFIGAIGNDVFGAAIEENFKARGVNSKFLQKSELPTGVAHIWVEASGENRIIIIPGANHDIDLNKALQAIAEIPKLDIVIGQCEIKQEVTTAIFKAAKAKGATTIFQQFPQIQITHYTVPGCVELNYALKKITTTQSVDAAIAFGAVIRGGTPHFDYVCQSVTQGITQLNTEGTVPIIFGVLTLDNEAQAWERLGGTHGHKGEEAAIAALKMIQYKRLA